MHVVVGRGVRLVGIVNVSLFQPRDDKDSQGAGEVDTVIEEKRPLHADKLGEVCGYWTTGWYVVFATASIFVMSFLVHHSVANVDDDLVAVI